MSVRTAKTQISGCQADLSLRWAHTHFHFVGFVMRRLIYLFRSESVYLRIMMSIKVIMLRLGLTAFYFLRLLIQFIIIHLVWVFGMVRLYGMGFSYHTTYQTTIPYQVLQYAESLASKSL